MNAKTFLWLVAALILIGLLQLGGNSAEKTHKLTTISPRKFADSLHAVIAADREAYARLVVQRLAYDEKRLPVREDWEAAHALPVPAQILRSASRRIQNRGAEFSYTLRSSWPINPSQGPQTEVEKLGLEHLAAHPQEPFYQEEELGGRSYFTALYPDTAIVPSCLECHNQHPDSPRRDFKLDDLMGAIVIRVPLEF